jgi:hypothetical protein
MQPDIAAAGSSRGWATLRVCHFDSPHRHVRAPAVLVPRRPPLTRVDEHQALLAATRALMLPLARLLVARGVPYAQAEESLKTAMVEAAREAHPDGLPHRLVSRIATTTGINRREVTRLTRFDSAPAEPQRSAAANTFMRWRTNPAYLDAQGAPLALARQGDAPSFESLARSVTQDVHPRSLLDELLRLGLARHDAEADSVTLILDAFVPSTDRARMLEFLAHNVGDHLSAAVANVLGPTPRHLERAVFADGLSTRSIAAAEAWVAAAWRDMADALIPVIEKLIADEAHEPESTRQQRFRAGLYAYTERDDGAPTKPAAREPPSTTAASPAPAPGRARAKSAAAAARPARPAKRRQPDEKSSS